MTDTATRSTLDALPAEFESPPAAAASDTPVLSILSLVSSILALFLGMIIPLSIVAIVLGTLALSREPRGRTMAVWGIVVGSLPAALVIAGLILAAAFIIPFGAFALAFGG
ncbi:MAG: DUF4190 domain-containing protein [Rhodoglobus sp.]